MIVSKNVPSIAIVPCFTGLFVFAAACAIGALPSPASFENTPLEIPYCMARAIADPAKPPATDVVSNAFSIMILKTSGIILIFINTMIKADIKYIDAIIGTKLEANKPILLTPPIITTPEITASTSPVTKG